MGKSGKESGKKNGELYEIVAELAEKIFKETGWRQINGVTLTRAILKTGDKRLEEKLSNDKDTRFNEVFSALEEAVVNKKLKILASETIFRLP